jgi:hypothetical protein
VCFLLFLLTIDIQNKYTESTFKCISLLTKPEDILALQKMKRLTLSELGLQDTVRGLVVHRSQTIIPPGKVPYALGAVISLVCLHPKFSYLSIPRIFDHSPPLLSQLSEAQFGNGRILDSTRILDPAKVAGEPESEFAHSQPFG